MLGCFLLLFLALRDGVVEGEGPVGECMSTWTCTVPLFALSPMSLSFGDEVMFTDADADDVVTDMEGPPEHKGHRTRGGGHRCNEHGFCS